VLQAVELAKAYPQSQCFINDYWQLAIEAGAYGVHLGQEISSPPILMQSPVQD
jgi:hydroxymethylpyrimidine kinase/phosphomethylpyrimidine kinase/thiamine-phosphate diphosphorylase